MPRDVHLKSLSCRTVGLWAIINIYLEAGTFLELAATDWPVTVWGERVV